MALSFEFDRSSMSKLNSNHLAWILNTIRKHNRENITAETIQSIMDEKFPESEHRMLWQELINQIQYPITNNQGAIKFPHKL